MYQPITISKGQMTLKGKYKVFGANGYIGYYHDYNHYDETLSISCRGENCGTINLIKPKSWITGNSMVVLPNEKILTKYLYYSLSHINIKKYVTGGAQPQLTRENLKPLVVVIPTLTEVTKVQTLLSKIDFLINEKEKEILLINKSKKKILNLFFNDTKFLNADIGLVKDHFLILRNYSFSREKEYDGGNVNHIHYGDIHTKLPNIITHDTYIPSLELSIKYDEKDFIQQNDIIVADASEDYKDLGKSVFIADIQKMRVLSGLHTFHLRPKDSKYSLFFKYYTESQVYKRQMARLGTGLSVFGISKSNLANITFPIPKDEEKIKNFSSALLLLDKSIILEKEELQHLQKLKKILINKMLV